MKRRARPAPASQKEKVKAFLDVRLDQGSDGAYEAAQLLRGQVQRGIKQGGAGLKQAAETAKEGSLALLARGFVSSGAELAEQLVEALAAADGFSLEEGVASVVAVDDAFGRAFAAHSAVTGAGGGHPAVTGGVEGLSQDDLVQRFRFLKAAVAWSAGRPEVGAPVLGAPALHARCGRACWAVAAAEADGVEAAADGHLAWAEAAIKHQVLGEAPLSLAADLCGGGPAPSAAAPESGAAAAVAAAGGGGAAKGLAGLDLVSPATATSKSAKSRERSCAVLRAVLQFLAVENFRDANAFWAAAKEALPDKEPKSLPALGAVGPLLKVCEYDAPDLFQELNRRVLGDGVVACGALHSSGQTGGGGLLGGSGSGGPGKPVHPSALLRIIGTKLFGIAPPPNMMTSLLKMFSGGGGGNDEDE